MPDAPPRDPAEDVTAVSGFPGVVAPMVTPFTDDGALALERVPAVVEFLLGHGIAGLVVAGTTGEGYALDMAERRALAAEVQRVVAGRVPVLLGVGGTATREALAQAELAREVGADGLMVAAPAYVLPTQTELGEHVLAVLAAAGLPAVLYDYPDRTGVNFDERSLDLLAAHPLVVGIKEASGDLTRVRRLRRRYGSDLPIVCGSDTLAMRYLELGVDSWIAGLSNVLPFEHVQMLEAVQRGDLAVGWELQHRMMPFLRDAERQRYTPKAKFGLELRGVPVGPPRRPLNPLDAGEADQVRRRLDAVLAGGDEIPPVRGTQTHGDDAHALPLRRLAHIGGRSVPSLSGATMPTLDPSTGRVVAEVAACDAADVDAAVRAAREVFERGTWSRCAPSDRRRALVRWSKLIARHAEEIARLDSLEGGKPITDCRDGDVPETVETIRWFGEAADKVYDRVAPTAPDVVARITREPIGVVGAVIPWNFPAVMFAWKVAPALAVGNSVVVKPAEQTSMSALLMAELAVEAGVPEGVLNVVPGLGETAGAALGLHRDVDMVTFTGSTEVGRYFLEYSARSNLKRITLECGGKSPQIVLESARDLDEVAREAVRAAFWNMGENCSAGTRLLVQATIHDALLERLVAATRELRLGDPLDPHVEVGPLIDEGAGRKVLDYVARGVADGAVVATGGGACSRRPVAGTSSRRSSTACPSTPPSPVRRSSGRCSR